MNLHRSTVIYAQRSWFGEDDNERCDRGNQEAFTHAVTRIQKETNRRWDGILVECFDEREANTLKDWIDRNYRDLTIPVYFTWLKFDGS